jgi:hypothetical protein
MDPYWFTILPHLALRVLLSLSPSGRDGREAPVRAKEWVRERIEVRGRERCHAIYQNDF